MVITSGLLIMILDSFIYYRTKFDDSAMKLLPATEQAIF